MKKVLAIAPYPYLPFFSGGQKLIAQFFEYLGKETDLTVITAEGNDLSLVKNYRTIPLLKKSFSRYMDSSLVSKISALIKKEGFDIVIWEHPYLAWLAFRVRKRTGIKTIIHTHNIEYQRFRSTNHWWWPLLKIYERWSFKKADLLLFITPEDMDFAVKRWKIKKEKCLHLPSGVSVDHYPDDRSASRKSITSKHNIGNDETIIQFNGLLDYKPNLDALRVILDRVNPLLLSRQGFQYKIIVCGKRLPAELNSLINYADKNIIYAGFTEDISLYYKATDIFLNPVQSGGGIKTKMVEAIAYGDTVVATETGAMGMDTNACGNKLIVIADNNWEAYTAAIVEQADIPAITPVEYYQKYYWGNVVKKLLADIQIQ